MAKDSDLEGFLKALRAEGEEELARARAQLEEEIADMIADRRRAVEVQIGRFRERHAREVADLRCMVDLRLRGAIQKDLDRLRSDFLSKVRLALEQAIMERLSSREARLRGLRILADEALSVLGPDAILAVPEDLAEVMAQEGYKVTPVSEDPWGGCVATADEGGTVLENTLRVRLEKIFPEVARELAALFKGLLDEDRSLLGKLRIS